MREYLIRTSQSPRPLPSGRWQMSQRWNDLLFAHWPVPESDIARLLPQGLEPDVFQGSAWLGVVPFWLDRIKVRGLPAIPGMRNFPDLNVRTYVRDQDTGTPGMYFFSLDATNLAAVALAHTLFHLPYHWAEMRLDQRSDRQFSFYSRRRFSKDEVIFKARYRGLGPTRKLAEARSGTLEYFLMEPVYAKPGRTGSALEPAPCSVTTGRSRSRHRAQRSGPVDRNRAAEHRAGAALFEAPGGIRVASRAGALCACRAAGNGGGHAAGLIIAACLKAALHPPLRSL